MGLLVLIASVIASYKVAEADNKSGWLWALITLVLSVLFSYLLGGLIGPWLGGLIGPGVGFATAFAIMFGLNFLQK